MSALSQYVAAYQAQAAANRLPGDVLVDAPGLHGLVRDRGTKISLLACDDRARPSIAELLARAPSGALIVLERAPATAALVAEHGWVGVPETPMVRGDLSGVAEATLAAGLRREPIRLGRGDGLLTACELAVGGDPTLAITAAALAAYLRALRPAPALQAAYDDGGVMRATAGYRLAGDCATVIFVNTDRGWRRRGVGHAMTALALHRARADGATRACLMATDAGAPLYRRLGFASAGPAIAFSRRA